MRSPTPPYPPQPRRRSRRKGGTIAIIAVIAALAYGANLDEDTQPVVEAAPVQTPPTGQASPEPTTEPPSTPTPEPEREADPESSPTRQATPTPTAAEPDSIETEPALDVTPGTALAVLADLEVKGRASKAGYDRDLFQYRAYDLDRNGCDVRNDILRRDLADLVTKPDTQGCVVLSGTLISPYSGETIDFVRDNTGGAIEIDHVVALSDAWQKGAQA